MYNPSGYDPINRETAFGMARKKRGIKSFFEKLFMKKLKHVHDGSEPELFTKENLNLNKAVLDGHTGFDRSGAIEVPIIYFFDDRSPSRHKQSFFI